MFSYDSDPGLGRVPARPGSGECGESGAGSEAVVEAGGLGGARSTRRSASLGSVRSRTKPKPYGVTADSPGPQIGQST